MITRGKSGWPTEMALRTLLIAACGLLIAGQADAKFLDRDTLSAWCLSEDAGDQEACLGYIIGVADVLTADPERNAGATRELCLPGMDADMAVEAVRRYLRAHPGAGGDPGADLVATALSEAFPCP